MQSLHTFLVVQDTLTHTKILRRDLKKLVVGQEFQALLQAHLPGGNQPEGVVGTGSAGIGKLLLLADVDGHILAPGTDADNHTAVDLHARADKEGASFLGVEEAVGDGLAGFEGNQGAVAAPGDIPLVRRVGIEDGSHNTLALGVRQEVVPIDRDERRVGKECIE